MVNSKFPLGAVAGPIVLEIVSQWLLLFQGCARDDARQRPATTTYSQAPARRQPAASQQPASSQPPASQPQLGTVSDGFGRESWNGYF